MMHIHSETGFEDTVRHRAYALWESEGRPAGRDTEHWRVSEQLTRAELAAPAECDPAETNPAEAIPTETKKAAARKAAPRKKAAATSKRPAAQDYNASL